MSPAFVVAIAHLRLKETSKLAISSPSHAVALLYATLNNDLLLHDDVNVDPDAVAQYLVKLHIRIKVLLLFCSSELAPEALTTPMTVFG